MSNIALNPESFYPFIFEKIRLKEACWINNEPCFTRRAIGEWLEHPNPRRAINNIIKRNPHIEDPRWSTVLSLRTVEGDREVTRDIRVYNPIGLQLIIFESRQPKARAYKIVVANLVYAFMRGELKPPRNVDDVRLQIDCEEVLRLPSCHERAEASQCLAEKYSRSQNTVYNWRNRIKHGENPSDKPYGKHLKGKHHYISDQDAEKIKQIADEAPWLTAGDIISMLPRVDYSAKATVYRIMRVVKDRKKQQIIKKIETNNQ